MADVTIREQTYKMEAADIYQPAPAIAKESLITNLDEYKKLYDKSLNQPSEFWGDIASEFYWKTPPNVDNFYDFNFDPGQEGGVFIKWMEGAETNICYNVLDRVVSEKKMGDKVAFYWVGNHVDDAAEYTYTELLTMVCKFSNVLKSKGVVRGDRVAIYMPMTIELVVAMLACARIGAVHSIIFAGFSSDSLCDRILDSEAKLVVTTDGVFRGEKCINLKNITQEAIDKLRTSHGFIVDVCIVVRHLTPEGGTENGQSNEESDPGKRPVKNYKISWCEGQDHWWHDLMSDAKPECDPVWVGAEDSLFMLYTSGSTGTPKGVVHTVGGYMLYTATTFKYTFDFHDDDVYFCTADIGWITGHSYVTYGPMANGATSIIFEGVPYFPNPGRFWDIVDKYRVTKFYTAPTAIRLLMKYGKEIVKKYSRKSLKVLGTVGEPINPEAWKWYYDVVGDGRCSIVDTFWQTETGGHMLTPFPGVTPTKPGSACFPFFGVDPAIMDENGVELEGACEGYLVFKRPWPGMMRTIYKNHSRFEKVYFSKFPGYYTTGDGCKRDEDGYYWITGRIDDMLNVAGHLLSTAQIESALIEHPSVAESAAVGRPHQQKGECLYCFITLKEGLEFSENIVTELKNKVREKIGPFATPDFIQEAPGLPKTRSGKIMRRILRQVAVNQRNLGDTSTLADPGVVEQLFKLRPANA